MTEFLVDLSKARFDFDMELLEHKLTELPAAEGGGVLVFDHQQAHARLGDQIMFKYSQVESCYWNADSPGLECIGTSGRTVRLKDPAMGQQQAKEILFRLANICQWNPQNSPPVVKKVVEDDAPAFDPAAEFPLPRESVMVGITPQSDWTKPDDLQIKHGDRTIVYRIHEQAGKTYLDGSEWYQLDSLAEIIFRRQEKSLELVFKGGGRFTFYIGEDRPAQILENRVKGVARSRKLSVAEAAPHQHRKITPLSVQLGRTVIEGGQLRIPGNRDVLFHHGQKCIRLDGEVFAQYADITQVRSVQVGGRLNLRIWIKPATLIIMEDSSPTDERSQARIPEVIKVLCTAVGRPLEVG